MLEWELDPKDYSQDTISEMKMMIRCLSNKAYEKNTPGFVKQPGQIT